MSGTYKVLSQNRRLVAYLPCLRTAIKQTRVFSSFRSHHPSEGQFIEDPTNRNSDQNFIWPDSSLGPLATKDKRFPLPGSTGISQHLQPPSAPLEELQVDPTELIKVDRDERQASILTEFNLVAEMETALSGTGPWECVAQDCPQLLRKDFQELFPGRDLSRSQLTVITISHRTKNDMSMWSPEVEAEREDLLKTFMKGGEELCSVLKEMGYWADFVDPSSGRPYYGEYTNATLFETDERYRRLGFEIQDLGCCKVISHHLWGTHTFLGSVFTNCPTDDPVLEGLLKEHM
ncbi:cobalamin trafficking protein CblD-like [Liolophura sinensis]|uniref:cobalamin trafficking protein CblD-like n=1 Tax=Liolophura sinensis TaxID=3198878 RepID=UPI0031589F3E